MLHRRPASNPPERACAFSVGESATEGPPGRSSAATVASHKKQSSWRVLRKARLLRATTRYEQGCGDSGDHRRGTRREKAKQQRSFRSGVAAAALENSGNSATLRSSRPLPTIVIP
ncbi:hypothetical protein HPB50_021638 [Hyalomma asiaticum]|uniref:Uncharacterized protein n=1 Tax=Hyalomma asiaticum TaxID=266040 RepID=A0ACB7TLP9_HYAAI|nr:hypothetical protein HPB50_021638 [Hyalomma asiaticum]